MTPTEKKTSFRLYKLLVDAMGMLSEANTEDLERTLSNANFYTNKEAATCTVCGMSMIIEKTVRRNISTMALGNIAVNEYVMICPAKCTTQEGNLIRERSNELAAVVARGANYGYDIEVFIGLQRFLYHRQRLEIKERINSLSHVDISEGEISILESRFLKHFTALHSMSAKRLSDVIREDGGYPLHIDSTCESGRGMTLAFYAGWRGWVLGAWKISSENDEEIIPCLKAVEDVFGAPLAYITDLGRGMMQTTSMTAASHDVRPRIFICHMHFIKAVGTSIFEKEHDCLTDLLRKFEVKKKLGEISKQIGRRLGRGVSGVRIDIVAWASANGIHVLPEGLLGLGIVRMFCQWILDYISDCGNYRFPFAFPQLCLFKRCEQALKAITNLRKHAVFDYTVSRFFERVQKILYSVLTDKKACNLAKNISEKEAIFNEFRHALQLDANTPTKVRHIVNDETIDDAKAIDIIETCVSSYCLRIQRANMKNCGTKAELAAIKTILSYMDKYDEYLWGHVIVLENGKYHLVDRTNNAIEVFFGDYKHGERRRSGRKRLTYDLETSSPAELLVKNLTNADYMNLVCDGSFNNLPRLFSYIDQQLRLDKCSSMLNTDAFKNTVINELIDYSTALPFKDRRLVRSDLVDDLIKNTEKADQAKDFLAVM